MSKFTLALLVFFFAFFALAPQATAEEQRITPADTTVKAEAKNVTRTKAIKPADRLASALPYSFFL